jgi:hypothetical protein
MLPHALRREIIALLCLKALALVAIYQLFFATGPEPGSRDTRAHVLASMRPGG